MSITALPSPPSTNDTANFATKADALLAALPTFVTETNAVAVAMNLNSTTDTSASSVAIGTGAKSFTVTTGKSYQPGMWLVIADTAAPSTNQMIGTVTSYDTGTGALVMNITAILGSGTKTAWVISQTASGGAIAGPLATSGITGAAASGENDDITAAMLMVVGDSRNLRASLTANGASITFTADQVVVGESLTGLTKRLASYSQALNTATTGAGGMDTGALPTSGFLAVYAIVKPDGTKSILGVDAATSTGSIYSGANMPSGYTYSALIGIWPTNATPALLAGLIDENRMFYPQAAVGIVGSVSGPASLTSRSISVAVPPSAKSAVISMGSTAASSGVMFALAADATGTGLKVSSGITEATARTQPSGMASSTWRATHAVPIITAQTIYWMTLGSSGENLYCLGYGF